LVYTILSLNLLFVGTTSTAPLAASIHV